MAESDDRCSIALSSSTPRCGAASPGIRMLVVGDVMLDRYLIGDVARISPEAPVPVVRLARESVSVGGAGNVALNLAGLGVHADVAGWTGDDAAGARLRELLGLAGVRVHGVEVIRGRPTTTKTRVLSRSAAARPHRRRGVGPAPDGSTARRGTTASSSSSTTATTRSCSPTTPRASSPTTSAAASSSGAATGGSRCSSTRRASTTASTSAPPRSRPTRPSSPPPPRSRRRDPFELIESAARLRHLLDLDFVTLTRGEAGISLIEESGTRHVPARAREVFDVSGAGDTAIATLAAGIATGLDAHDAAVLANLAAGIIVGKSGTVPIRQDQLLDALGPAEDAPQPLEEKLVSLEAAVALVEPLAVRGSRGRLHQRLLRPRPRRPRHLPRLGPPQLRPPRRRAEHRRLGADAQGRRPPRQPRGRPRAGARRPGGGRRRRVLRGHDAALGDRGAAARRAHQGRGLRRGRHRRRARGPVVGRARAAGADDGRPEHHRDAREDARRRPERPAHPERPPRTLRAAGR